MLKDSSKKKIILVMFHVDWCRTHYCLPFNMYLPIDFNTLSRKTTQKHIQCLGTCRHQWQVTLCLIRDSHYWLLVKQFYGCSMTKTSFTLVRLYCASWRPSPLLVAFLASVNSLHYWLVIRRFHACLTSMHIFTCIDLCCSVKRKSRPWVEACITQPCFLSQVAYIILWR